MADSRTNIAFWSYIGFGAAGLHPQVQGLSDMVVKYNAENEDNILVEIVPGKGAGEAKTAAAGGVPPALHWHAWPDSTNFFAAGESAGSLGVGLPPAQHNPLGPSGRQRRLQVAERRADAVELRFRRGHLGHTDDQRLDERVPACAV